MRYCAENILVFPTIHRRKDEQHNLDDPALAAFHPQGGRRLVAIATAVPHSTHESELTLTQDDYVVLRWQGDGTFSAVSGAPADRRTRSSLRDPHLSYQMWQDQSDLGRDQSL